MDHKFYNYNPEAVFFNVISDLAGLQILGISVRLKFQEECMIKSMNCWEVIHYQGAN